MTSVFWILKQIYKTVKFAFHHIVFIAGLAVVEILI